MDRRGAGLARASERQAGQEHRRSRREESMITDFKSNGGTNGPLESGAPAVPNAIEVKHIVKKYGEVTAVDDESFSVKEEEIFGLLGPNGAGKSNPIRMMTTLIPLTARTARVARHDVP